MHHQTIKAQLYRQAKAAGYTHAWNDSTISDLRAYLAPVPEVAAPVPEVAAPVPEVAAPVPEVAARAPEVVSLGVQSAHRHVRERFRVNSPEEFYRIVDQKVPQFIEEHGTVDAAIQVVVGEGDKQRTVTISPARYQRAGQSVEQALQLLYDDVSRGLVPGSDIEGLEQNANPGAFSLSGMVAGDIMASGAKRSPFSFAVVEPSEVGSKASIKRGELCFYRAIALLAQRGDISVSEEALNDARHRTKIEQFTQWSETHGVALTVWRDILTHYSINRKTSEVVGNTIYYPITSMTYEQLLNTAGKQRACLVVTADGKHVEAFKEQRAGLMIDSRGNVVDRLDKSIVRRAANVRVKREAEKEADLYIVSYDLETVFDAEDNGFLKCYSISWSVRKSTEHSGKVHFYYGWDSLRVFVDWILGNLKGKKLCLLGWNSSRFDNFWLIEELMERDLLSEVKVVSGSILNARFCGSSFVFDLCRYLSCPLAQACAEFKPAYKKCGELASHSDIQSAYNRDGGLDAFFGLEQGTHIERDFSFENDEPKNLEIDSQIALYNVLDVLSCDCIYTKVDKQLRAAGMLSRDLCYQPTIGGMAWGLQKKHFAACKSEFTIPKLPLDKYLAIRASMVAGRTQCHAGRFVDLSGEHEYLMYDAKSLYPYSYLNNTFPCGELIDDDTYENCEREGRIGFFVTRFSQPDSMAVKILPRRQEGCPLDWNYAGEQELLVNSIDLGQLIKHGAVIHEIKPGFSFSKTVHGSRLFAPMAAAKAIKEAQDALPAAQRNSVLRNMAKLVINAVSGKVVQRCFTETQVILRSHQKINEILDNYQGVKFTFGRGSSHLISYTRPFEECYEKQAMPAFLGSLIYSFARRHMTDSLLSRYPGLYQDTDSLLMRKEVAEQFARENPELVGGAFGQFELEDTKGLSVRKVLVLSPKNYFLMSQDGKLLKKGFKGVNLCRDALLTTEYVEQHPELYTQNRDGSLSFADGVTIDQKHAEYYGEALSEMRLVKPENVLRFYEEAKQAGKAYVLCSSLRKRVDLMRVQACYTIKTIRL